LKENIEVRELDDDEEKEEEQQQQASAPLDLPRQQKPPKRKAHCCRGPVTPVAMLFRQR
jgi:hypothetical protein